MLNTSLPISRLSFPLVLGLLALGIITPNHATAGSAYRGPQAVTSLDQAVNWKDSTLDPVTDPIVFEDAIVRSEIRPVMGFQHLSNDFFTQGGDLEVYGVQLRWAATERLGFMLTKGGYNVIHPGVGPTLTGWGDLNVGAKYALIDDKAHQFILTPGVLFEIPSGEAEVQQGRGSGIFNVFVAAEKGFDKFHVLANVGVFAPIDTAANSTQLHYHLQADYRACQWFHPFIAANGYTVLSSGNSIPLTSEGYDLVNFGSSAAGHSTQLTLGGGFRSHLTKNLDFGFSYEKAVSQPTGLLDDRYTFDFVIHF